jgi:hypothetical protein
MATDERSLTSQARADRHVGDAALDRRLLLYALAAGATLACSTPSHAEVLFTPSNAVLQGLGRFDIDLDHDGSTDFSLVIKLVRYSTHSLQPALFAYGNRPSHQIVARSGDALALKKKTRIGGGRAFRAFTLMETFEYGGPWANVSDRFLGVRFLINGEVHYGWIGFRMVGDANFGAYLAGWAYETEPDTPILAGDMGTAAPLDTSFTPSSLDILASGHNAIEQRRKRNTPRENAHGN